jgi:hypothetical protein
MKRIIHPNQKERISKFQPCGSNNRLSGICNDKNCHLNAGPLPDFCRIFELSFKLDDVDLSPYKMNIPYS